MITGYVLSMYTGSQEKQVIFAYACGLPNKWRGRALRVIWRCLIVLRRSAAIREDTAVIHYLSQWKLRVLMILQ